MRWMGWAGLALAGVVAATGAAAWQQAGYGCAAARIGCPAHLTPADARLILGLGTEEEAAAYYDATFGAPAPAGRRVPVMTGPYRPVFANFQATRPGMCHLGNGSDMPLGSPLNLTAGSGSVVLGSYPFYPYAVSESEFMLAIGLCGPVNNSGARGLSEWVGAGAHFWAAEPPERAHESMDFLVTGTDGRVAIAKAGDHGVLPISAGGRIESWFVTLYEIVPGNGQRVEIGFGGAGDTAERPNRPAPGMLPPERVAEIIWQGDDPCAALRRIAAMLDMTGQGDLLPLRAGADDGPQACADLYRDLQRRLRGEAPPAQVVPVFLWTLP
jgi:hypothetical protein